MGAPAVWRLRADSATAIPYHALHIEQQINAHTPQGTTFVDKYSKWLLNGGFFFLL